MTWTQRAMAAVTDRIANDNDGTQLGMVRVGRALDAMYYLLARVGR